MAQRDGSGRSRPAPLEAYSAPDAPPEFGLHNTGAICYLNSLLQALIGATAFVRGVLRHRDFMARTATGRAVYDFVWHAAPDARRRLGAGPPFDGSARVETKSAPVLHALVADLCARKPGTGFGPGQQSASECLVLLLDMLSPAEMRPDERNPVADMFATRYQATITCDACGRRVSSESDVGVQREMFSAAAARAATPEEFAAAVRHEALPLEDYKCDACGVVSPHATREYTLKMVSEVFVALLDAYPDPWRRGTRAAGQRAYFPQRFELPGRGTQPIRYAQVGQVQHSGTLSGGHYVATALRAGGRVALFNDSTVAPGAFGPAPGVYLAVYQVAV
jgi:ubiquitin C-terminal hydrolase